MIKTGIILAAGRGSRLKELTQNNPKCLVKLAGRALLDWQIESLKKAGIERIIVVRGYKKELLNGNYEVVDNLRFEKTNMVSTMLEAFPLLGENESVIISYSDIVYKYAHVVSLMNSNGNVCITYDKLWESLWRLRQDSPLVDSETFKQENGVLKEIGNVPKNIDDIQGQYMGLIKITPLGRRAILDSISKLQTSEVEHLDMTSLLMKLIKTGTEINVCPVEGGWCECDTQKDINCYEKKLREGNWEHDWR